MLLLSAFNTMNADYTNYYTNYITSGNLSSFRYIGYNTLMRYFYTKNYSFELFRVVFFSIAIILLILSINNISKNVNAILAYYLFCIFPLDIVQMKAFLSEALILLAITIFLQMTTSNIFSKKKEIFNILIVMLLIGVASLVHFSAAFYVIPISLYLILYKKKNMKFKIYLYTIIGVILIYCGGINIVLQFGNRIGLLGDMEYLTQWTQKATRFGYLYMVIIVVLMIYGCWNDRKSELKHGTITILDIAISKFVLTSALTIPLIMLNMSYNRLLRIYIILFIAYFVNKEKKTIISRGTFLCFLCFFTVIVLVFILDISPVYLETLGSILEYNSLL